MKNLFLIISVCAYSVLNPFPGFSQVNNGYRPAKITDPGSLYSTYNLSSVDSTELLTKITAQKISEIKKLCVEKSWPEGINTLDERLAMRSKIMEYNVFVVASFFDYYVVVIPSQYNSHMPSNMQSAKDFYFIMAKAGVSAGYIPVTISNSMDMMSTYSFTTTDEVTIIKETGSEFFNIIKKMSTESNWPTGINSLTNRDLVRSKFPEYKAFIVIEFDGKYLLMIPASENKHMPANMQMTGDFFIVINKTGITYR